jgi:hypothetical protein
MKEEKKTGQGEVMPMRDGMEGGACSPHDHLPFSAAARGCSPCRLIIGTGLACENAEEQGSSARVVLVYLRKSHIPSARHALFSGHVDGLEHACV